ncbi:hypothetical protein Q5P01_017358 [Channa striata]|uniref:Dynamin N-terminal domain-containing protein n=1 Tax=Channa striata TaxID=64152 RepID=A0AA88M949_CHASR|nr:hypothetical protein Q5P01_017358 [Channa striata]
MDDFVLKKLTEWGFSDWIERFEDEGIDREGLECLEDKEIDHLFPKVGPRAKFKKRLKLLQGEQSTTSQGTEEISAHEQEDAADLNQVDLPVLPQQGLNTAGDASADASADAPAEQVQPSASDTNDEGKRKLDLQGECSNWQLPTRKRRCTLTPGSYTDGIILSGMKDIMRCVYERINFEDNTKLNAFLKTTISDLETDKRELVGVFGRTGAGKSSLINAVIGEKDLLPSGEVSACTTVMIKVEANTRNSKYEAEIEFITKRSQLCMEKNGKT